MSQTQTQAQTQTQTPTAFTDMKTASRRAGLSRRHMLRHVEHDRINIVRIGKAYLIRTPEFEAWLASYQRDKELRDGR